MPSNIGVTQTYTDLENMIYDIVHKFIRRYSGEFDEILSQANYYFVLAYESYEQGRSSFNTWAYFRIWKGLLNERQKQLKPTYREEDKQEVSTKDFLLVDLLDGLSDDSQFIVQLVLESPKELQELFTVKKEERKSAKIILQEYLKGIGWTIPQIKKSFRELAEVLND